MVEEFGRKSIYAAWETMGARLRSARRLLILADIPADIGCDRPFICRQMVVLFSLVVEQSVGSTTHPEAGGGWGWWELGWGHLAPLVRGRRASFSVSR